MDNPDEKEVKKDLALSLAIEKSKKFILETLDQKA